MTIEVHLKKNDGPACEADEVFELIEENLDGALFYVQSPEHDNESEYEVTKVLQGRERP